MKIRGVEFTKRDWKWGTNSKIAKFLRPVREREVQSAIVVSCI